MELSQNAFPLLSRVPDRFVEERGDCVSGNARAGCSHGSGFILGPAPFLLGQTWIWPEVSNYSFATT